jgi:hypothetical protein
MREVDFGTRYRYREDYQMKFQYSKIQESDLIIDITPNSVFPGSEIK